MAASRRWVPSNEPMMAPVPPMPETNSIRIASTAEEAMVPRLGHGLGDFLDLLLVELLPDVRVILAEREHDHGRLLRPRQPVGVLNRRLFLDQRGHQASCNQPRMMETDSSG